MTNILNKATVLVLNRNWQAINVRTPQEAVCMMATNVATALDIELGDIAPAEAARAEALRPVTWHEWATLPIRPHDNAVQRTGPPSEARHRLLTTSRALKELPATAFIRSAHSVADWNLFVKE